MGDRHQTEVWPADFDSGMWPLRMLSTALGWMDRSPNPQKRDMSRAPPRGHSPAAAQYAKNASVSASLPRVLTRKTGRNRQPLPLATLPIPHRPNRSPVHRDGGCPEQCDIPYLAGSAGSALHAAGTD